MYRISLDRQGFSVVEVVVVLAILSFLTASLYLSYEKMFDWTAERKTEFYLRKLALAFEKHYERNVDYSYAKLKYLFDNSSFTNYNTSTNFNSLIYSTASCGRSYTPFYATSSTDPYTTSNGYSVYGEDIIIYDLMTSDKRRFQTRYDVPLLSFFGDANCEVLNDYDRTNLSSGLIDDHHEYVIRCRDGWGGGIRVYMTIKNDSWANGTRGDGRPSINDTTCWAAYGVNLQPDFDPFTPQNFEFRSAGVDRTFYTADDISLKWSTAELDNKYIEKSRGKAKKILKVIEGFHYKVLSDERNRPASVSLQAYDDVSVPWEWRLMSENSSTNPGVDLYRNCTITNISACRPSLSCACTGLTDYWVSGGGAPTIKSMTPSVLFKLYKAGLIQWSDMYDAFGWALRINLVSAATRGYPPVPGDNYNFLPPFITTVSVSWRLWESIATGG